MKGEIHVGDYVKDSMTGFEGVAVAVCKYLSGSVTVLVQSKSLTDNLIVDPYWFDAYRLTVMAGCEEYFEKDEKSK